MKKLNKTIWTIITIICIGLVTAGATYLRVGSDLIPEYTNLNLGSVVQPWDNVYANNFEGALSNVVEDTTPDLGGQLNTSGYNLTLSNGTETLTIGQHGIIGHPRQSHVEADITANQGTAASTWTTITNWREQRDNLGEFDATTGIFTATEPGVYQVDLNVLWINCDAGDFYLTAISVNGGTGSNRRSYHQHPAGSHALSYDHHQHSKAVYVAAGGTIRAKFWHNNAGVTEYINGLYDFDRYILGTRRI